MEGRPNNFRFIGEAHKTYDDLNGLDYDSVKNILSNSGSESFGSIVDSLEEGAMFYVTYRPKLGGSSVSLLRRTHNKITEMNLKGTKLPEELKMRSLIEEWNYAKSNEEVERAKANWAIVVGFLNPEQLHYGVAGNDVPYSFLIPELLNKGYDPLMTIRRKDYVSKVEAEMGEAMVVELNKWIMSEGKGLGIAQNIGLKLRRIAERVRDDAEDYIIGGEKPALDMSTIYSRRYKASKYHSLYPNGIEEPLSETGNLTLDLQVKVISGNERFTADEYYWRVFRKMKEWKAASKRSKVTVRKAGGIENIKSEVDKLRKSSRSERGMSAGTKTLDAVNKLLVAPTTVKGAKQQWKKAHDELKKFIEDNQDMFRGATRDTLMDFLPDNMKLVYRSMSLAYVFLHNRGLK